MQAKKGFSLKMNLDMTIFTNCKTLKEMIIQIIQTNEIVEIITI